MTLYWIEHKTKAHYSVGYRFKWTRDETARFTRDEADQAIVNLRRNAGSFYDFRIVPATH